MVFRLELLYCCIVHFSAGTPCQNKTAWWMANSAGLCQYVQQVSMDCGLALSEVCASLCLTACRLHSSIQGLLRIFF